MPVTLTATTRQRQLPIEYQHQAEVLEQLVRGLVVNPQLLRFSCRFLDDFDMILDVAVSEAGDVRSDLDVLQEILLQVLDRLFFRAGLRP